MSTDPPGTKTEPLSQKNREVRDALLSAWNEIIRRHYLDGGVEAHDAKDQWMFYGDIFMMIGNATGMLIAQVSSEEAGRKWLMDAVVNNIMLGCKCRDLYDTNAKIN